MPPDTAASASILCREYPLGEVSVGILHVGLGAFHRAHQANYIDALLEHPDQRHWGICAVELRAENSATVNALNAADGHYLLRTDDGQGVQEHRSLRSIREALSAAENPVEAAARLADPAIKLVTITVTEAGYYQHDNGSLNTDQADIKHDLQSSTAPRTLYGYLSQALAARMRANAGPITLLCCDNLRHNGQVLERGLKEYLACAGQQALLAWVVEHASFPCSMVDRITPRASAEFLLDVEQRFGVADPVAVNAETFQQWVVEDNFANERPALERVDVSVVTDVSEFEEAKIRILNGGHTALCYLAALAEISYFHDAIASAPLRTLFDSFQRQEVIPGLGESPLDLEVYQQEIAKRFANPSLKDTVARICADGYSKMPQFIMPSLEASLARGETPQACYTVLASWFLFCQAVQQGRIGFDYAEPYWAVIQGWFSQADPLQAMCADSTLFGALASTEQHLERMSNASAQLRDNADYPLILRDS